MSDLIDRQAAIDALRRAEALTRAFGYHNVIDTIRELPSEQPVGSLWFRIGEICVDESRGFISAGRAVEKIRGLLREVERRKE